MRLKIELAALIIGLIGACQISVLLAAYSFGLVTDLRPVWDGFVDKIIVFFSPEETGFRLIACFILIGYAGLVLMCVNLVTGLRKLWRLRSVGYVIFLILSQSLGLAV